MANVQRAETKWSIDKTGTATCLLGNANDRMTGTLVVHVVNTSSLVASIVVKARSAVEAASDDAVPFVAINYLAIYLNAATGTNTYVSTAITDTSIIFIPATGLQIALDVTYTSGTGMVYVSPVAGAAA